MVFKVGKLQSKRRLYFSVAEIYKKFDDILKKNL